MAKPRSAGAATIAGDPDRQAGTIAVSGADRIAAARPAIILDRPQMGENIGAAARAMHNFALSELRLVAPRDGWPNPRAQAMASGADAIIDNARSVILVADNVKFGRSAPVRIADLGHIDYFVTDRTPGEAFIDVCERNGVRLDVAQDQTSAGDDPEQL